MFLKVQPFIFFTLMLCLFFKLYLCNELVQMRIVNDISNLGWNPNSERSRQLKPKVSPQKYSGPNHFKYLQNKCFNLLQNDYKYELCPFDNATQHERTLRWNPYSGILGVWTEWKIENNSFVAMIMKNGEDCGNQNREVEVELACGDANKLVNVSEPHQCHYNMIFQTPLACHKDALLVYPILNATLQREWDELEQNVYDNIITHKGYKHYLTNLFIKAGFVTEHLNDKPSNKFEDFKSLEQCNIKYHKLFKENENLKKELGKN